MKVVIIIVRFIGLIFLFEVVRGILNIHTYGISPDLFLELIFGILCFRLTSENKSKKEKTNSNNKATQSSPAHWSDTCNEPSYYARMLVQQYEKAYYANSQDELMKIVESMIGDHYASSSARELDDAILYEIAAGKLPFTYPMNGSSSSYQGLQLLLLEIFHNQNYRIMKRDKKN